MTHRSFFPILAFLFLTFYSASITSAIAAESGDTSEAKAEMRIVSLGGPVTETIYALGAGNMVVGSDSGSLYPAAVLELARLNYHRQTSAESVLSLNPTHVFLTVEAGPPVAIEQIKQAGVKVVVVPSEKSIKGASDLISILAAELDLQIKGNELVESMDSSIRETVKAIGSLEQKPSVLFLYARQGMGAPMVGGKGSGVDEILALAGGSNAGKDVEYFKPLTPEALVVMNPDYILLLEKGFEALGGNDGLKKIPGLTETTAMKENQVITMSDDLLLTYGPRTDEAVRKLATHLHPEKF